jgi:uncharacterized membrane protein
MVDLLNPTVASTSLRRSIWGVILVSFIMFMYHYAEILGTQSSLIVQKCIIIYLDSFNGLFGTRFLSWSKILDRHLFYP